MVDHLREELGVFDGISGKWPTFAVIALWVTVGLILYLIIGNLASILMLELKGVPLQDLVTNPEAVLQRHGSQLLGANAIGLALGLGGIALLASWLDSSRPLEYLRMTGCTPKDLGLSCIGLFCLLPIVLSLGILNEKLPLPEILQQMEDQQLVIVEWLSSGGGNFWINLVLVAITPALFEEVFFRGFLQRRAERSMGIVGGILLSGILFGLFHLRLTQALPLAVLGCYMAYVTWRTGSLMIPIVLHFLNNGLTLAVSEWGSESMSDPETIPWFMVVVSGILFSVCIIFLHRRHE